VAVVEPGNYRTEVMTARPEVSGAGGDAKTSPYRELWDALTFWAADFPRRAGDPAEVACLIADIVEADQPAFRYPVGRVGDLSARAWIAERCVAWAPRDSYVSPDADGA
jgi:hypothetical protein